MLSGKRGPNGKSDRSFTNTGFIFVALKPQKFVD